MNNNAPDNIAESQDPGTSQIAAEESARLDPREIVVNPYGQISRRQSPNTLTESVAMQMVDAAEAFAPLYGVNGTDKFGGQDLGSIVRDISFSELRHLRKQNGLGAFATDSFVKSEGLVKRRG